jgi:hypothetical protein
MVMDRVVIGMEPHRRSVTIEACDTREVLRATEARGRSRSTPTCRCCGWSVTRRDALPGPISRVWAGPTASSVSCCPDARDSHLMDLPGIRPGRGGRVLADVGETDGGVDAKCTAPRRARPP